MENPSLNIHVLFGCVVVSVGTPMLKLLKYSWGTYCGNPAGPDGFMPNVPTPVTKPRSDNFAKLPLGLSVVVEVRKKLTRASLTAVGPRVLVLLMTICCARDGVKDGKPDTLEAGRAWITLESSKW